MTVKIYRRCAPLPRYYDVYTTLTYTNILKDMNIYTRGLLYPSTRMEVKIYMIFITLVMSELNFIRL